MNMIRFTSGIDTTMFSSSTIPTSYEDTLRTTTSFMLNDRQRLLTRLFAVSPRINRPPAINLQPVIVGSTLTDTCKDSFIFGGRKSLNNQKMIIQKSLHPQFGHCMAKQQLIKSHNIAKYSRKIILLCDKRKLIGTHL